MENNVYTVCDANVRTFAETIAFGRPLLPITADEEHKTMDTVMDICRWLLSEGAGRDATVFAVGGGCTTDLVGFAASIYKRGIKYANYPTTLLAMVDAAIGGKTGVNVDNLKNMLGVIRRPFYTRPIYEALGTLPEREFRSGAAEMLKTFLIADAESYKHAVKVLSQPSPDIEELKPLIETAAMIKEDITERDPYEEGHRRVLNLGHTWGHAIEWRFPGTYTHGEAVAMGIIASARKSEELGLAAPGLADRLSADFKACGLPTELPCALQELEEAIRQDKKAEGGKINYVLIRKPGKVDIRPL